MAFECSEIPKSGDENGVLDLSLRSRIDFRGCRRLKSRRMSTRLLLVVLVVRIVRKRLAARYRVFVGYLVFETVSVLISDWIILDFGLESSVYRVHYYAYSTLTPALQIWVLIDLARRNFRLGSEAPHATSVLAVLSLLVGLPVFVFVGFLPVYGYDRVQAISLVFQMVLTLLIYLYLLERRDIDPGKNLKAILGGMTLMVTCQSLNFLSYFQDRIGFEFFQFGVPAIYGVALLIFTAGLWNYAPASASAEQRTLNLGLQRSVRLMLHLLYERPSS